MKRWIALVMALLMVLSLWACSEKKVSGGNKEKNPSSTRPTDPTQGSQTDPTPGTRPTNPTQPTDGTQPTVPMPPVTAPTEPTEPPMTDPTEPPVEQLIYDITMWVSEPIIDLTYSQIDRFNETNEYGIYINATIEAVGEGDAASSIVMAPYYAPDLFCFAQDQLERLIQVDALTILSSTAADEVLESHIDSALEAVLHNDQVYGFPMTADNGYFMYYDKSVIPTEALGSLEELIALCEESGRKFSFELENAWYMASFFFATGCESEWLVDETGKYFTGVVDNFNSEKGYIAAQAMQKLLLSNCYRNSSYTGDFSASVPSAIVVSGTWNYENAKALLGDNLGVAALPSFTEGGRTYHLSSFSGSKLMGIKPQTDPERTQALQWLALYLTGEECQLERFGYAGWGPSHVDAATSNTVLSAPHLVALMAQNQYAKPMGNIHGAWWDIARMVATNIREGCPIEEALAWYQMELEDIFDQSMQNIWGVVGSFTDWTDDIFMECGADGIWYTVETIWLDETSEFKVRKGASWDENYGLFCEMNGYNVTLEALGMDPGYYHICFDEATGLIWLDE